MSDIQAYLASKYMSGARADAILSRSEAGRPKKKKRRIDQALPVAVGDGTGLLIADEDNLGNAWGQAEPEEEDTDAPVVTAAAKTLRLKKSNWSLPSASSSTQPEPAAEDPPAGSSTATATSAPPVKKRKGGLLTAAQLKEEAEALAIEEARKEAEREQERLEAQRQRRAEGTEDDEDDIADDDNHPDHQRTVYRDRSGKIVDAQAERAEQLKAEAEDRARQAAKKDWNKGLVQRNQREVEAQRERQVASTSFARSANDRDMNDELRNEVRREDPAAAFLTKRKKKGPQRPKYTGPAPPPNRFGILPGFRWDGVDRSTGYEAKLFQKINERSRKAREAYQWSTEEM